MRRIRASAAAVATEIGMSREAVNNWRRGYSKPSKKHRDKVVACSHYLRLSDEEINELLASVGFDDEFAWHGQMPQQTYQDLFEQLDQARPYPIMMLLTQAHLDQPPQQQVIIEAATARYPQRQVRAVQLPWSANISPADFFSFLGQQLDLPAVSDELSFEFALNDLLREQPLTLVITRFEQGSDACRNQLAGILRNLTEMHVGQLHLILCGGEQLSALKYAQGDLSLLNIATARLLQFNLDAWISEQQLNQQLTDQQRPVSQLLPKLIGNHPALASTLTQNLPSRPSESALMLKVANSDVLYCDFNQVLRHNSAQALADKLHSQNLGPYRPHLQDPVLRKLFWLNLICADANHQLCWQSEPIRQVGFNLLQEQQS